METLSDISGLCRTCLSQAGLMYNIFDVKISEVNNIYLTDFITRLTSIQIAKSDHLSINVCGQCINELRRAFSFAQMCIENDVKMKQKIRSIDDLGESVLFKETYVSATTNDPKKIYSEVITTKPDDDLVNPEIDTQNADDNKILHRTTSPQENKDHGGKHTEVIINKKHSCEGCNILFRHQSQLRTHKRIHHKIHSEFMCNVCGQKFNYIYLLNKHNYKHQDNKPFPCSVCDKGCITAESLRRHMKVHDKNYIKKTHMCNVCSKEFRYPSFLAEHMKNHTGEKPHLCSVCGKGFRQSGTLQYHMRSHTGNRPYACSICQNTFASPGRCLKGSHAQAY